MAELIELKSFSDSRGSLSVLEDFQIPFTIKRFFYIYDVDTSARGGHRHITTRQAAICINGSCKIYCNNGKGHQTVYSMDTPVPYVYMLHVHINYITDTINQYNP